MKIDSSHFETMEELLNTIKMWYREEEMDYYRWFGLEEMKILVDEIERLNKQIEGIREERDYLYNKYSTENKWLYEDLEKANNIINEMEQFFIDNANDEMKKCFDKLHSLKGVDKE